MCGGGPGTVNRHQGTVNRQQGMLVGAAMARPLGRFCKQDTVLQGLLRLQGSVGISVLMYSGLPYGATRNASGNTRALLCSESC